MRLNFPSYSLSPSFKSSRPESVRRTGTLAPYAREGGKYLLIVFNRLPEYYLPLKRREYVKALLRHGRDLVRIDFSREPKTIINSIRDEDVRNLVREKKLVEFDLQKHTIEPIVVRGLLIPPRPEPPKRARRGGWSVTEPQYYFYLLRILEKP